MQQPCSHVVQRHASLLLGLAVALYSNYTANHRNTVIHGLIRYVHIGFSSLELPEGHFIHTGYEIFPIRMGPVSGIYV